MATFAALPLAAPLKVARGQERGTKDKQGLVHGRDGDGDRPLTVPQIPPETFSSQLPLALRFYVISICSSLMVFFFLIFFGTSFIA